MTDTMDATDYADLMTHDEYVSWVVDLARREGWLVYWVPDWMHRLAIMSAKRQRRSDRPWPDKGYPDLWLVHPVKSRFLVLELKTGKDRATPEQRRWMDALVRSGVKVCVCHTRERDAVEALLTAD